MKSIHQKGPRQNVCLRASCQSAGRRKERQRTAGTVIRPQAIRTTDHELPQTPPQVRTAASPDRSIPLDPPPPENPLRGLSGTMPTSDVVESALQSSQPGK